MSIPESEQQLLLETLKAFLRIPSVSTDPNHKADILLAAEFVAAKLRSAGLAEVQLISGAGHPMVYGEWLGAPGKPTLLFYGHYDVQPPEPLDEWISPAFEPTVRNNNIYARGATDDKGQALILMEAVARTLARTGKLPVNVKFLIEGEEEVGGEAIEAYVKSKPARLQADAAIICDSEMFAPELPTICVGLRGIIYGELHITAASQDLHSGVYGGAVPNPLQAAAEIIAALKGRDGKVAIPGFYEAVQAPTMAEREAWASLPFNEEEYRAKEVGAKQLTGEPDISVLERVWARPTFEVHGIKGGFIGDGAKTVIPAKAVVKISTRLVPNQDPAIANRQLSAAIAAACPVGVTAEWKLIHGAPPCVVDTANPFIEAAATAMERVFGNKTVFIRSGGSIPVVGLLQKELGQPCILMGFGLPDDNLHAPNEKLFLPNFFRGIEAIEYFLEESAKA